MSEKNSTNRPRVKYENPPVVEVTCGVLFKTPQPIHSAHIGLFWQLINKDFPRIEEAAPLPSFMEASASLGNIPQMSVAFGLSPMPPLRRTWFIDKDGQNLIQIQSDRLIFNWKSIGKPYKSYDVVIKAFEEYLLKFEAFLKDSKIGMPTYQQLELAYVNHITLGTPVGKRMVTEENIFVDHIRNESFERFLPIPEAINWTSIYSLPEGVGRIYSHARSVYSNEGKRILRLDLTARGYPADVSKMDRRAWFDLAHEWITQGFADFTDKEVQTTIWKRTS
jgi:uncharacterized protein (TIGR04255 family)